MSIPHGTCDTLSWSQLSERDTPVFATVPRGDHPVYHFLGCGPPTRRFVRVAGIGALLSLLGSGQWVLHQCVVLLIWTSFASPTTASRTTTWTWWPRPVSEISALTRGYKPRWTCSPMQSAGWVRYLTSGAAQAP